MQSQQNKKFGEYYKIGKKIASGAFGVVKQCQHLKTGEVRAVKILRNSGYLEERQAVFNEINILKDLDHPNILKFHEYFEEQKHFYIVTEFCDGSELFDEITARGKFSEEDASKIMKQILEGVKFCHSNHVVHRDIRPENIMINSQNEIKIIDFGTSVMFEEGKKIKEKLGTPYYIAPEVLAKSYGPKCDIWSCGVVAYILLSGNPPFNGRSDQEIMKSVKNGKISFDDPIWNDVSKLAKDFVVQLLEIDQNLRPSAEQALQHPWFQKPLQVKASSYEANFKPLSNFKTLNEKCKIKQATFIFFATQVLSKDEQVDLERGFKSLDADFDGRLSKEEFKNFAKKDKIAFEKLDLDNSGVLDFSEFAVGMESKNLLKKFTDFFKSLDQNNTGSISIDQLNCPILIQQIENQSDDGEISVYKVAEIMYKNCGV